MTDCFGGECVRGGGVETSERPEEPAVDGLMSSGDSDCLVSFLGGRFRVGTISGHVHLRWVSRHRLQSGFSSSHLTFFVLHVRQPVLLRVNLPRLRCTGSGSKVEGAGWLFEGVGSTVTVRWTL